MLLDTGLDTVPQHRHRNRLGIEAEDVATVDRFDRSLLVGIAGQHDPHRIGRQLGQAPQHLDPIHARHAHVAYDHGEGAIVLDFGEGDLTAVSGGDVEALAQQAVQSRQQARLVIDDQDAAEIGHCGHSLRVRAACSAQAEIRSEAPTRAR